MTEREIEIVPDYPPPTPVCRRCMAALGDTQPWRSGRFVFCSQRCRRLWTQGVRAEDDR